MLRGRERKKKRNNRYAKLKRKEDFYTLKINWKGNSTVGKAKK